MNYLFTRYLASDLKREFSLLLNGVSHDTKVGLILLVWSLAKKFKFSFLLCADPLRFSLNIVALDAINLWWTGLRIATADA